MTTLNLQVSDTNDDGSEGKTGTMYLTNNTNRIDEANEYGLARFQSVTVANAALISSATFQFYIPWTSNDDVYILVQGEDIDDSPALTSSTNDISNRTLTTASTTEAQAGAGVGWYSIDVTSIVQEIVNRGSWASGNDLSIIWQHNNASCNLDFRDYSYSSSLAAKLDIDYSTGLSAPSITAPWSTQQLTDPIITWGQVATANLYNVQIDTDSGFGSPDIDITTTSLSYIATSLSQNTDYYIRVAASDDNGSSYGSWSSSVQVYVRPPIFKGAKGYAATADYGRAGAIEIVTNTNDLGAGSFRQAVTNLNAGSGGAIVFYGVSGEIDLQSQVDISQPMFIVGQTADYKGICFQGHRIRVRTSNVVFWNVRFRLGWPNNLSNQNAANCVMVYLDGADTVDMNYIGFYNCSFSWGLDTNFAFYNQADEDRSTAATYVIQYGTMQECIISEPFENIDVANGGSERAYNCRDSHGTDYIDYINCLFMYGRDRNPWSMASHVNMSGNIEAACVQKIRISKADAPAVLVNGNIQGCFQVDGSQTSSSRFVTINVVDDTPTAEPQHQIYINGSAGGYADTDEDQWELTGGRFSSTGPAHTRYQTTTAHDWAEHAPTPPTSFSSALATIQANAGPYYDDTIDDRLKNTDLATVSTTSTPYFSNSLDVIISTSAEQSSRQSYPDLSSGGAGSAVWAGTADYMDDTWATANGVSGTPNGYDLSSRYTNVEVFWMSLVGIDAIESASVSTSNDKGLPRGITRGIGRGLK